jgi:hypothetical protein
LILLGLPLLEPFGIEVVSNLAKQIDLQVPNALCISKAYSGFALAEKRILGVSKRLGFSNQRKLVFSLLAFLNSLANAILPHNSNRAGIEA